MVSLAMLQLTNLIELKPSKLIFPNPEAEELLQQLANRAALPLALQVIGLRFGSAVAKGESSVSCRRKYMYCTFYFFRQPRTVAWWPGGGEGAGRYRPPSEDFLGALNFEIANVKYLTKYVKSSLSTDSK